MNARLPWLAGGMLLAMSFFLAVFLVKPIGVSTQFVIADAMVWNQLDSTIITKSDTNKKGYASSNAYLNKSGGKYAKNAAKPLNYSFIFVLAMMAGAGLSSLLSKSNATPQQDAAEREMPQVWRKRFGSSKALRYASAFGAGFLVLYGARLAGGCTSGHMMSGIMQTSLSGYVFTVGVFASAIPVAMMMFNSKPKGAL